MSRPTPRGSAFAGDDPIADITHLPDQDGDRQPIRRLLREAAQITPHDHIVIFGEDQDLISQVQRACGPESTVTVATRPDSGPAPADVPTPHSDRRTITATPHLIPLPDGSAQAVIIDAALSRTTPVGPALREIARILTPGGRACLYEAAHARLLTTPSWFTDLSWADTQSIRSAMRAGPRDDSDLERILIFSARRAGLLPTLVRLGFLRTPIGPNDVDAFLHQPHYPEMPNILNLISRTGGADLARRYATTFHRAAHTAPVLAWTPIILLETRKVDDAVGPPAPPTEDLETPAAEWALARALTRHGEREEGLRNGWPNALNPPTPPTSDPTGEHRRSTHQPETDPPAHSVMSRPQRDAEER